MIIRTEKDIAKLISADAWMMIFFIDDDEKNTIAGQDKGWQTFLYKAADDNGLAANKRIREILLDSE